MKFNNKLYNQSKDAAMGATFAPAYTPLSMKYFEIKFSGACTLSMESCQLNILMKTGTVF